VDNALQRDTRLDFAKAIAISLVLFWHLVPIRILVTEKSTVLTKIIGFGLTQFYLQISLVAVPMFLLVSMYLFYQKIEDSTLEGMSKRVLRIGRVYLFWTAFQFAFYYGIMFIQYLHNGVIHFWLPIPVPRLLMEGGPPLPIVYGSVFYFLFVLLISVLVSTVFYSLRHVKKLLPLIGISVVIVSILYFEFLNLNSRGLEHWRIENFIIYIPLSYFLLRQESGKLVRYIPYFYMGYVLFSAQDVYLRHQGYHCGAYSRISIVFGSIALFSSALQLKNLNKSTVITFLSTYSLGIFATHKYWQLIVNVAFQFFGFSMPVYHVAFPLDLRALTMAVISMLLTFSAILFGGHTLIKRYIT
jgi:fucose 4-O-acetylase-like acetyltransferase